MDYKGAGGSEGGTGRFIIGMIMLIAGVYLLLNSIHVMNPMRFGRGLFQVGGVQITSGYVLIPFIFGIGMIFYDSRKWLGWILAFASMIMLVFGVITSAHFTFNMSAFELIMILILAVGGLGLVLSGVRRSENWW